MSAFVKKYPRARVSRHPRINGWVIDLIQRSGASPRRVQATYVTAQFAARAARVKLGLRVPEPSALPPRKAPAPVVSTPKATAAPKAPGSYGTCKPCGRPMRPAGSKSADYPGTTLRQREGLCQTCCQKAKREGTAA